MYIKKIILTLVVLISVSCEVTESDAGGPPAKDPADQVIDGEFSLEETPEGILKDKFSEASYSCSLWFQKGEELDLNLEPSQTIAWDLINDFSNEKELTLVKIIDSASRVDIIANLNEFDVHTVLVNEGGDSFKMTYNPLISMSFSYQISEKLTDIQSISSRSNSSRSFKHNNDSVIVIDDKRSIEGELEHIFTYLKCDFLATPAN